jgi:hypothetical protein
MLKGNALVVVVASTALNMLPVVSTVILAGLLTPEAFGVAGSLPLFSSPIVMVTDVGPAAHRSNARVRPARKAEKAAWVSLSNLQPARGSPTSDRACSYSSRW